MGQGLRLTRRGRIVVRVLLVAAAMLAAIAGFSQARVLADGAAGRSAAPQVVVVRPGDTLSGIAERELLGVPMGEAVARLQELNRLTGAEIYVGQPLQIG